MELRQYLVMLQRWGWFAIMTTCLAVIASLVVLAYLPRLYEAHTRYLVGPAIDNPNVGMEELRASSKVGRTYAELVTSRPILGGVLAKFGLPANIDDIETFSQNNLSVSWAEATQILSIRARASDPQLAANIANALGDALIARSPSGPDSVAAARRENATAEMAHLNQEIAAIETEINQLVDQIQRTTDKVSLETLTIRLEQRRLQLAAVRSTLSDQTRIVQNPLTNQLTVVETAVPNPEPVFPADKLTLLAALMGGLILGLVGIIVLEYFTDAVYTPEDLSKASGVACIGAILRHKRLRGSGVGSQLVTHVAPETLVAETFRTLRANLHKAGGELRAQSLLITSPTAGNGKSEIAANLAISFARLGKRTLLVDAHLRRPRVAALFGVSDSEGLASLLDEPGRTPQPVAVDIVPGLSVIPAGSPAPNSWELLGSQRMYRLMQAFKTHADIVIVDSPSLQSADALALASQVDGVLLVAHAGRSVRENVVRGVEGLRLVGANVFGTVLNRVKPNAYGATAPELNKRLPTLLTRPGIVVLDQAPGAASSKIERLTPDAEYRNRTG